MVTAISRLASLLRQATSGEGRVPAGKPDPSEAALIRTLARPAVTLRGASQLPPFVAPSLPVPLGIVPAQKQPLPQAIDAYRAVIELEEPASTAANATAQAKSAPGEVEISDRGATGQSPNRSDAGYDLRAQPAPAYALASPLQSASGRPRVDDALSGKATRAKAGARRENPAGARLEATINARMMAFGLTAFALILLVVLVVF